MYLFKSINNAREFIEDKIADVLDNVQQNESIDSIEKKIINAGIQAGLTYFLGSCPINSEKINVISESIVEKGINKINPKISKQLRK